MRHGLMRWDPEDLPESCLEQRMARLRAAMREAGFDALILYTNIVRPAAVTYVTAFTPYWSDALLLLPSQGAPVFATALSKRVSNWIRSTNPLSEIVNTPKPGVVVGERLRAGGKIHRVGVVEYDMLPLGISQDLTAAAPRLEYTDATDVFSSVRRPIDSYETALIAQADRLAWSALTRDRTDIHHSGELLGAIEQELRAAGAEEVYLAVAPDLLDGSAFMRNPGSKTLGSYFAVTVSLAVKGSWVRRTHCFARAAIAAPDIARCEAWWQDTVSKLSRSAIGKQLNLAIADLPGVTLRYWTVEGCRASYPLEVLGSSTHSRDFTAQPGSMVVFTVALDLGGVPWIISAPFIIGADRWRVVTEDTKGSSISPGAIEL